jgi:hypothetical protein
MQVDLKVLKDGKISPHGLGLFCVVRDEIYFLPFLLEHYRRLGVDHFVFYDDRSSDGSRELLELQPDCAIVTSDTPYGAVVAGGVRYCHVLKDTVPAAVFSERWGLIIDADEFVLLPEPFVDLKALCAAVRRAGGTSAVAALVDFYPEKLNMRNYSPGLNPFSVNRYCDKGPLFRWRAGRRKPDSLLAGIRHRLAEMFFRFHREEYVEIFGDKLHKPSKLWKVPLVDFSSDHRLVDSHSLNVPPFLGVQIALAHFKFYPGLDRKISDALATKGYYASSREYRMLERAVNYFGDVTLLCEQSIEFRSLRDLEQASLLSPLCAQVSDNLGSELA